MTLVESMVALWIMAVIMLGFIGTFVQSRRTTESSVMNAAATSLVYGIIEQIKGMDYTTLVPSTDADANAPTGTNPPYIRVRINQDQLAWLRTVYTQAGSTPLAPTTTPVATATATSLGAIDNIIGPLPLSSVSGSRSQRLTLNFWVWVDEMPDVTRDVVQVKRVTIVYTYTVNDGYKTRTIRDREVFIRTRFDL
jgi:type II secretory pathway pseudopilin PulG